VARTITERIPTATYVWDAAGRTDETFIKDARTQLRVKSGVARPLIGGIPLPTDLTVLTAHLELTATDEWPGSPTVTARRLGPRKPMRQLTWDNQPDVHPDSSVVSVTHAGSQTLWRFNVTDDFTDALTAGESLLGWRITADVDAFRFFHGPQAARPANRPRVVLSVTKKPGAPTDLVPSFGAVSVSHPVLGWVSLLDFDSVQVQVDVDEGPFTAPLWTSAVIAKTEPRLALAATDFTGLDDGDDLDWRVKVHNDSGWGPWSLPGRLARVDKPVITITSPADVVTDNDPPIGWTQSTGVQTAARAILSDDEDAVLWDSRWTPGDDQSAAPTKGLKRDGDIGVVEVRVRDDVVREGTPGDPDYAVATKSFTLDLSAETGGIARLTAAAHPVAPWVDLAWEDEETPDVWRVTASGERLAKVPGPDLITIAGRYGWRDWTAIPNVERTYQLQALVDGAVTGSHEVSVTPSIRGIWVGDPETGLDVLILGRDDPTAENVEQTETLYPIGGDAAITVRSGRYGLSGTVTGYLANAYGRAGAAEVAQMEQWAKHPNKVLRLAWADKNIPATLKNIQTPSRRVGTAAGRVTHGCTFEYAMDTRG
jgi:hypothetical protein